MSGRILVLTAGYGEGHNAAARALSAAGEEARGSGTAPMVDVFALARPRTSALTRRWYLSLINRAPGAWRSAYAWLDRSPSAPKLFRWMRRELATLERVVEQERPDVICSTYPIYAFMLAEIGRRGRVSVPPHYNVVTDSISINSLWWRGGASGWFVPNPDSAEPLLRAGISADRVRTLGFPVALFFADHQGSLTPPPLGPGIRPRVLYIINSGTRGAADTARHLLAREDWDVTCAVGRDEALRSALVRIASRRAHPAPILGWTNDIPRLLMTHHVVISKAGGATTQESIAAHCPMLVNQIVPGQEEGNYELLRRHGIGAYAPTPESVVGELGKAFADEGRIWGEWRAAVGRLARPNAAREIVRSLSASAAPVLAPALNA